MVAGHAVETAIWLELSKALTFFCLRSYLGEIAKSISADQELSNGVRLVELYRNKNVDPSRSPCSEMVDGKRFEHRNF